MNSTDQACPMRPTSQRLNGRTGRGRRTDDPSERASARRPLRVQGPAVPSTWLALDAEVAAAGPLSQHRIAEVLGVSRARISQIELAALAKLRKLAGREWDEP